MKYAIIRFFHYNRRHHDHVLFFVIEALLLGDYIVKAILVGLPFMRLILAVTGVTDVADHAKVARLGRMLAFCRLLFDSFLRDLLTIMLHPVLSPWHRCYDRHFFVH